MSECKAIFLSTNSSTLKTYLLCALSNGNKRVRQQYANNAYIVYITNLSALIRTNEKTEGREALRRFYVLQ